MKRIAQLRRLLPFLALAASLQLTLAYYDPAAQRWITRDPILESGGPNMFAASANNPVRRLDALGLATTETDCKQVCATARSDKRISRDDLRGVVICAGDGTKCPCVIGYGPFQLQVGECPEIDAVVEAHESEHIKRGWQSCDPDNPQVHPAKCMHIDRKRHEAEECELMKQSLGEFRKLEKRASSATCRGAAKRLADGYQIDYDFRCGK